MRDPRSKGSFSNSFFSFRLETLHTERTLGMQLRMPTPRSDARVSSANDRERGRKGSRSNPNYGFVHAMRGTLCVCRFSCLSLRVFA